MSQYSTLIYESTTSTYFSPTIPPNSYVTRDDVDAAQEIQDKGIRREFKTTHEKIDALRTESTQRFNELTTKVDGLKSSHEKLVTVVDALKSSHEKLATAVGDLKSSHDSLTSTVGDLKSSHDGLTSSHKKLESEVHDLKALFFNQGAYKAWDTIVAPSIDGAYPTNFPDKVIKFWHLQRPRNHARLMSLIRFYKLDESLYYYYSEESHSFMSEEDTKSQGSQTEQDHTTSNTDRLSDSALQTLIKQQPLFVLRILADWLRLDFAAIQSRMPEASASPPTTTQKRAVEGEDAGSSQEAQKKAKPSTPPSERKSSPRARFDPNSSFMRALTRDPEELIQRSPESSEGHITWDRGSRNLLHRLPKKVVPPRSSPLPDDSSEGKLTSTLRLSGQSKGDSGSDKGEKPP